MIKALWRHLIIAWSIVFVVFYPPQQSKAQGEEHKHTVTSIPLDTVSKLEKEVLEERERLINELKSTQKQTQPLVKALRKEAKKKDTIVIVEVDTIFLEKEFFLKRWFKSKN